MESSLLDYELPRELIAKRPLEPRDASRLLVYRRAERAVEHRTFSELPDVLRGELVVVNDTRVVPARLRLRRESGGAVEVLLVERLQADGEWEALVKPSRRMRVSERIGPVELLEALGDGRWRASSARRAGRRAASPALRHAATRRSRAVPDRLCGRGGLCGSADGRTALHSGARGADRPGAGHAARGSRHVSSRERGDARGARAAWRAVLGRAGGVGADRGGRAGARRGNDDGARARERRARRRARAGGRRSSSRPGFGSGESTRC